MKESEKFISFPFRLALVVIENCFFLLVCIIGIIGCIESPENLALYLTYMCVLLVFLGALSVIFTKTLYMVEISDEKIKFKGLFRRYVLEFSQVRNIECLYLKKEGKVYALEVDVYPYKKDKFFYPFQFSCNKKTQVIAQTLWLKIHMQREKLSAQEDK